MKAIDPSREKLMRQFAMPPAEYGLYPGWWWEGQPITKEKLTWQLEEMKKAGSFATFFYVRYIEDEPFALAPPYGSDEFLSLFRHSLEEHQRLGMQAYFSEWSGQRSLVDQIAGDPEDYAALAGKRLVLHERTSDTAGSMQVEIPVGEAVLSAAAFRVTSAGLDGGSRHDLMDMMTDDGLTWEAPEAGWLVAVVTSQTHDLDFLNAAVPERWIEKLWQPYLAKVSDFIGTTFKGYMQDELDVLSGNLSFSPILLEQFIAKRGYDPRPWLVGLFYDIGRRTDQIRCDYYGVLSELLEENVYARFSRWHEERNMRYATIAVRGRQDMLAEIGHFGDVFKLMRWYHFPGNEDPQLDETVPSQRRFIDAKLSSSAAHIFERERAAVCAYWGTGWGMTMEQNLAWTNENYAYGLNLYDPHLAGYSLGGGWYEWVPPCHYFYHPYWKHYKTFSDYVRRMSYIMSQGVHRADVAILFPTTSIHANWLRGNRFTLAADVTASTTYNIADSLYKGGIDFDFIDDETLCQAEFRDGKLCVAGLAFRAVVLPPITTIRTETLQKLKDFCQAGGIVLAFQRLPDASAEHGRDDPQIQALLKALFGIASSQQYTHPTFLPPDVHESHFMSSIRIQQNEQGGAALFVPGEQNRGTNASAIDLPTILSSVMRPDVTVPAGDVYHTHQKIGDLHVYFLYNARPEARMSTLSLRVAGEPAVWDAFSGEVRSCHRFQHREQTTDVRLRMEGHQAVILSFAPSETRPAVVEDNLTDITDVLPGTESVTVRGTCATGGKKRVRVENENRVYLGEARVDTPPDAILLGGLWDFNLMPTMDNRWGDYRYPASSNFVGAEARAFKYMEEGERSGIELGWHEQDFNDANWPRTTYSFGPYWYTLGPFAEDLEPTDLLQQVLSAKIDPDKDYMLADQTFCWHRYNFSQLYGHESKEVHQAWGGLIGVSDYFVVFDELAAQQDASRWLFTNVHAPQTCEWDLILGGRGDFPRQAWINGQQVLSAGSVTEDKPEPDKSNLPRFLQAPPAEEPPEDTETRVEVQLREGPNTVLLRLVQPKGKKVWAYAAFARPNAKPSGGRPPIPRLRWFIEPTGLVYDVLPEAKDRIGWYRFEAPAGVHTITLPLDALDVAAWIGGKPVPVQDGRIELNAPSEAMCQVALRVNQKPGCYAGAAIPEPIAFECGMTRLPLGDWCDYALESYSGGVIYSKQFDLEAWHLVGKVLLDLGQANTTAEVKVNGTVIGVGIARPFRFDITEHVRAGRNHLEVTVYNTLANHYSIGIPSRYVFPGQTVSGLLGPVTLLFLQETTILALPL